MASPMLKEKQQPANGIPHKLAGGIYAAPTAVGRGARTPPQVRAATRQRAATHVGGGVPDAPEASRHRPSPGKPPGRACPAPTARRWASPMPSVNAHGGVKTPPYGPPHQRVPAPRRKFAWPPVNGQPTRVGGGVHDAPETSRHRPSPGKPPGRACPAPTARRRACPLPFANAHGGVKTPPYGPPHQRMPAPYRAAVRERRQKNRGNPLSRDCLGSLYKHISA